jgi:hypothetical protein
MTITLPKTTPNREKRKIEERLTGQAVHIQKIIFRIYTSQTEVTSKD